MDSIFGMKKATRCGADGLAVTSEAGPKVIMVRCRCQGRATSPLPQRRPNDTSGVGLQSTVLSRSDCKRRGQVNAQSGAVAGPYGR